MVPFLAHEASRRIDDASSRTDALLDHIPRGRREADHQGQHRKVRDVRRRDLFARPAILPFGRRQDRQVSGSGATPALSGAGRPRYDRAIRQRLIDFPAGTRTARDSTIGAWSLRCENESCWLRDRVRLLPTDSARRIATSQSGTWPLLRRTNQRYYRLRRGRRSGRHRRTERCALDAGQAPCRTG